MKLPYYFVAFLISACVPGFSQSVVEPMSNPTVLHGQDDASPLLNLIESGKPALIITYVPDETSEHSLIESASTRYFDLVYKQYSAISGTKPFSMVGISQYFVKDAGKATAFEAECRSRWPNAKIVMDAFLNLKKDFETKSPVRTYFLDADKNIVYVPEFVLEPEFVIKFMKQIVSKELVASNPFYDENWLPCSEKAAKYTRKIAKNNNYLGRYKVTTYYKSGKVQFEGYADRINPLVLSSYCRFYYENGQVQKEYEADKGKISSIIIAYHPNGKKAMEGEYLYGERVKNFTYYYPTGEKQKLAKYHAGTGRPDSIWTGWMKDGSLRYRATMQNNSTIFMDENTVFKYENGVVGYAYSADKNYRKIVSFFDEKGTKIAEYKWPAKDQTGFIEVSRYAPNGKLIFKNTLQEMYRIGLHVMGHYESWHENGQKRSEMDVDYKKMTGVATAWHSNGQIAEKVDYGSKTAVYYDPSGSPIEKPKKTIVPGLGIMYNEKSDLEAFNYIGNLIVKDADNF